MASLDDIDVSLLRLVRKCMTRTSDDGLLAFLACLSASMEIEWPDLAPRHLCRLQLVKNGVGDVDAARTFLESMFKFSENC